MSNIMIRELTTGDAFALDKTVGELVLIEKQHVDAWKKAGGDVSAARSFAKNGQAHIYSNAMLQRLQSALTHIQVLI
jgi:hypothetical protein